VGKITGFMEFQRQEEGYLPPATRLKNYKEFVIPLTNEQAKIQGARCMDCGIPFCNNGCPVNNIIPDWNDLVYRGNYREALETLHSTNNFPSSPAASARRRARRPVRWASTKHRWASSRSSTRSSTRLGTRLGGAASGGSQNRQESRRGRLRPCRPGRCPAAGARRPRRDRVRESDRVGGLLRYGIPDFKMEKSHIDRRVEQMEAEGVVFRTSVLVGKDFPANVNNWAKETIFPEDLQKDFDAVVLAGGAEQPRDLPVPGRELKGVHFAMDFLPQQNKVNAGDKLKDQIKATGKHVVGSGRRHRFRLRGHLEPPRRRLGDPVRTDADAAGAGKQAAGLAVLADQAAHLVVARRRLRARLGRGHQAPGRQGRQGREADRLPRRVERRQDDRSAGSEFEMKADLVLLAMGFVSPVAKVLEAFGVDKDARGNAKASTDGEGCYQTNVPRCLPPATCAAASRWWCGRSAKAASARARSTSS
jgi:glutamate synthase (NADPH/NADH) small chain